MDFEQMRAIDRLSVVKACLNSGISFDEYARANDIEPIAMRAQILRFKNGLNGDCGNMAPTLLDPAVLKSIQEYDDSEDNVFSLKM